MNRAALAGLILLASAGLARADAIDDAVKALPPDAQTGTVMLNETTADLTLVGPAKQAGKAGSYRVVVAQTQPKPRLFVQWIAGDKVANSFEIKEFGTLATKVEAVRAKIEGGDLSAFIDVGDVDGAPEVYELFVTGPAKYRFGKASN